MADNDIDYQASLEKNKMIIDSLSQELADKTVQMYADRFEAQRNLTIMSEEVSRLQGLLAEAEGAPAVKAPQDRKAKSKPE